MKLNHEFGVYQMVWKAKKAKKDLVKVVFELIYKKNTKLVQKMLALLIKKGYIISDY